MKLSKFLMYDFYLGFCPQKKGTAEHTKNTHSDFFCWDHKGNVIQKCALRGPLVANSSTELGLARNSRVQYCYWLREKFPGPKQKPPFSTEKTTTTTIHHGAKFSKIYNSANIRPIRTLLF